MKLRPMVAVLALAFGAALLSCATAQSTCVEVEFMTYNVQAPGWNQARRTQIVGVIKSYAPDVLGLHEATSRSAGGQLLTDLKTDYEPHHTTTNDPIYPLRKRSFKVLGEGVLSLGKCPKLPRGIIQNLTWVKVQTTGGQQFYFFNTHLWVSGSGSGVGDIDGNQLQAIASANFMAGKVQAGVPQLLAGDLNANQTSGTIHHRLEKKSLTINGTTYKNPLDLDDTWQMALGNAGRGRASAATIAPIAFHEPGLVGHVSGSAREG